MSYSGPTQNFLLTDKLSEIQRTNTQRADENSPSSVSWITEALQKHTDVDLASPSGQVLTNSHFISQLAPNTQAKF